MPVIGSNLPPTQRTDQPSTGKPIAIRKQALEAGEYDLYECTRYSIPVREEGGVIEIDPETGVDRQIVPGEAMFVTPLTISNNLDTEAKIRVYIKASDGTEYSYINFITIPGMETIQIPINGLSLLYPESVASRGDTIGVELQGLSEGASCNVSLYALLTEAEAGTHAPDTEEDL